MNAGRWPRIKQLFFAALEIEPCRRSDYLRATCSSDHDLIAYVETLLAAHDRGGDPTPTTAWTTLDFGLLEPGGTLGSYKIRQRIGSGAMGVVYLAEQQSPRRDVALKVINPVLTSPRAVERFQMEAELLGRLQHPGVAQIHEAGVGRVGDQHVPFLAMELVDGSRLTAYAAERSLSIRDRLELFCKLCRAIQHAHTKGIIHRDLKPANVLVTGEGQPKVLDFGVARLVQEDDLANAVRTTADGPVGTLAYMSPEQISADSAGLDTRSDVYALGVIYYELLGGKPPHDLADKSMADSVRAILEQSPAALGLLNRACQGDLEIIAEKALAKERDRRYQSASDLAADIERFLRREPILARPASAAYRLRKMVVRHKVPFVLAAGLLLVILASAGFATYQAITISQQAEALGHERNVAVSAQQSEMRQRQLAEIQRDKALEAEELAGQRRQEAEREAAIAAAVLHFLENDVLAPIAPERLGHHVTVREALDGAAANVAGRFEDEPLVEASIRLAMGTAYRSLGLYGPAEVHLERALRLREKLLGINNLQTVQAKRELAVLHYHQGAYDEVELWREVVQVYEKTLGRDDARTLTTMNDLAVVFQTRGRYEQAEPLLAESLDATRRVLGPHHPSSLETAVNVAALEARLGRYAEAESLYLETLGISRDVLGDEHPTTLQCMSNLAFLYRTVNRYDQAEPLLRNVLSVRRRTLVGAHPDTLASIQNLGALYVCQRRYDKAQPLLEEAVELKRQVLGTDHPSTLTSMTTLAQLHEEEGDHELAESLMGEALAIQRRVLGADHPDTLISANNLAAFYERQDHFEEAIQLYTEALDGHRRLLGMDHSQTTAVAINLATLHIDHEQYEDARRLYSEILDSRRRALGNNHERTIISMTKLGHVYIKMGRWHQAEPLYAEAIELLRRLKPPRFPGTGVSLVNHGRCLLHLGRFDEAEVDLHEGHTILTDALGAEHDLTIKAAEMLAELHGISGKYEAITQSSQPVAADSQPTSAPTSDPE